MKTIILMITLMTSASAFAGSCEQKSAFAVKSKYANYFRKNQEGSKREIEFIACENPFQNAVTVCEVSGSNGDGAGDITFLVTLGKNCARIISVELTGIE